MNAVLSAHLALVREIVSDMRHAAKVDGCTSDQSGFLLSIAHRVEGAALLGAAVQSPGTIWIPIDEAPRVDDAKLLLWIERQPGIEIGAVGMVEGWWVSSHGFWCGYSDWAGEPTHFMHVVPPTAPLEGTHVR